MGEGASTIATVATICYSGRDSSALTPVHSLTECGSRGRLERKPIKVASEIISKV
jgi:hypothetical protein